MDNKNAEKTHHLQKHHKCEILKKQVLQEPCIPKLQTLIIEI